MLIVPLLLASSIASSQLPGPLSLPTSPDSMIRHTASNRGVEGCGRSDATVDGSLSAEPGMMRYADACEKVLRTILNGR